MSSGRQEIRRRHATGEIVQGRILNTSANAMGFIVGVAGFLCYLPATRCAQRTSRRVGMLQDFSILTVDESNAMVVLSEPAYKNRSLRELNVGRGGGLRRMRRGFAAGGSAEGDSYRAQGGAAAARGESSATVTRSRSE